MALIIEDGSIVANANTYLDVAGATTLLDDLLGIVPDPVLTEKDLKGAAQWLETFRDQYQGEKVSPASQSLQFPRINVYIDCVLLPSDEIPSVLKTAQALAAYETSQGNSLQVNSTGQTLLSKSIAGAISVSYSDNGRDSKQIIFNQINSYLELLFINRKSTSIPVTRV